MNNMQKNIARAIALIVFIPLTMSAPTAAHAKDELHYQSIESVMAGSSVIVVGKGPSGEDRYVCDTDGDCERINSETAQGLATIRSVMGTVSGQGRYSTLHLPGAAAGETTLAIIDFADGFTLAGNVTVRGPIIKQAFSPSENTLTVVTGDGTVTTYDIGAQTSRTISITQTDLPFFSVSYNGSYISAYNYVQEVHRIWNTTTGALQEISGAPSYVEFNESETAAAFIVERNSHRNLAVATGLGNTLQTQTIASGAFTVEDHLYVGDDLFYMANKQSPLTWSIYKNSEGAPIVANNASYGDYLKRIDGKLAYLKIEGKNANVYLYDAATGTHTHLDAAPQSDVDDSISRNEITIAGRTAAHLAPEDDKGNSNLFIWLHGGPQRQTSLYYHPYLSYAVYDELLEKLAASGNHVLKLDYSGSYGYGNDFLSKLQGRVGTVEIDDVSNAIDTFTKSHDIDNVYLIGNSYGGYMAFRALNDHHRKIDGIVSINGVADWYGLIATIPSSPFSALFDGSPDLHNLPLYHSASVFTNVADIDEDIPLLVFYGTEDKTVPTRQSLQYDEFMRANGKNVSLVAFEGEEHVLRKRSTLTTLCTTIVNEFSLDDVSCR